ncbi:hypothetical protein OVA24_02650 [Luteolibacter sp. SL250]|uniref:hypothetical protein n=1 Tax=Luteolibacter sp. SL250 TaxID=2995170 RepID=UPI00226F684F|nr:hypothetical protein [Luteolibacter sp. SL250]WAC20279.1 hypothetical protein OVA24_02650 [Luteolibacter sp. SL250]
MGRSHGKAEDQDDTQQDPSPQFGVVGSLHLGKPAERTAHRAFIRCGEASGKFTAGGDPEFQIGNIAHSGIEEGIVAFRHEGKD